MPKPRFRGMAEKKPATGMSDQKNHWKNKLYFGDNLDILRDRISNDSVDLIYLDPPFKSGKTYNIIFQPEAGKIKGATAQIETFEDTWRWGVEAEKNYRGLMEGTITKGKPTQKLIDLMKAMRSYLGECSMIAYLSMMAPRLLEMQRVLKKTGSLYLHCDPTASHYLKLLMDAIFGVNSFRNEIIWKRSNSPKAQAKGFGTQHDVILFYSKSDEFTFNKAYTSEFDENYLKSFRYDDKDGRGVYQTVAIVAGGLQRYPGRKEFEFQGIKAPWLYSKEKLEKWWEEGRIYQTKSGMCRLKDYLEDRPGQLVSDLWMDKDVSPLQGSSSEFIGYATQKPESLLERVIKTGSNEADLVLDPFCGCGTTVAVAEKLGRRWVGIDIAYLAIDIISKRLKQSGTKENTDFEVDGEPKDAYSAEKLAQRDPFQFQVWCISRLNATPSQTKSGDKGVDGIMNFPDLSKTSKVGKGIIQVKGTASVNPSMVRDLKGTLKSQDADFGILVTLKKPTQGMINEATKEGYFNFMGRQLPRIQLLTAEDLFRDPIPIKVPRPVLPPYKKPTIKKELEERLQKGLFEN